MSLSRPVRELDDHIWDRIIHFVRRPIPLGGTEHDWCDLHQADLTALMRVNSTVHKFTARHLYTTVVVANLPLFFVGVEDAPPSDPKDANCAVNAGAVEQSAVHVDAESDQVANHVNLVDPGDLDSISEGVKSASLADFGLTELHSSDNLSRARANDPVGKIADQFATLNLVSADEKEVRLAPLDPISIPAPSAPTRLSLSKRELLRYTKRIFLEERSMHGVRQVGPADFTFPGRGSSYVWPSTPEIDAAVIETPELVPIFRHLLYETQMIVAFLNEMAAAIEFLERHPRLLPNAVTLAAFAFARQPSFHFSHPELLTLVEPSHGAVAQVAILLGIEMYCAYMGHSLAQRRSDSDAFHVRQTEIFEQRLRYHDHRHAATQGPHLMDSGDFVLPAPDDLASDDVNDTTTDRTGSETGHRRLRLERRSDALRRLWDHFKWMAARIPEISEMVPPPADFVNVDNVRLSPTLRTWTTMIREISLLPTVFQAGGARASLADLLFGDLVCPSCSGGTLAAADRRWAEILEEAGMSAAELARGLKQLVTLVPKSYVDAIDAARAGPNKLLSMGW